MKIALIGNIGGNLPALEAVLTDLKRKEVDLIINAGGSTVNGPFPNETLDLLRKEHIIGISGKTDRQIAQVRQKLTKISSSDHPDKWLALKSVYEKLTVENREYLNSLDSSLHLELEFKKILIVSEAPSPEIDALRTVKSDGTVNTAALSRLRKSKSDIIIWADKDEPSGFKTGGIWLFKTGSMSRFPSDTPRAFYTIIHFKPGFFQFRHYSVPYDILRLPEAPKHPPFLPIFDGTAAQYRRDALDSVNQLLLSCISHEGIISHSRQVTRLAVALFDDLVPLHGLNDLERHYLECAALLHDIGWIAGQDGHHKVALNIIINTVALPFSKRERFIIGSVARYHRKSIPDVRHLHFATLEPIDRRNVTVLSGILRVADGLDRSHQNLVEGIQCTLTPEEINLTCTARAYEQGEIMAALGKGALLEQIFGRKLVVEWNSLQNLPQAE